MSLLSRIEVRCRGEIHHISTWEPGDEDKCGAEHVVYGPKGYIICYEDHDVETDLTVSDLTGMNPWCFLWPLFPDDDEDDYSADTVNEKASINTYTSEISNEVAKELDGEKPDPSVIITALCLGGKLFKKDSLEWAVTRAVKARDYNALIIYMVKTAIKKTKNEKSFLDAARYGDQKKLASISIDSDHDIEIKEIALIIASAMGHNMIVKYLVGDRVDIHTMRDAPFRLAAKNGKVDTVSYLAQCGADPSAKNNRAIKSAAKNGDLNMIELLLGMKLSNSHYKPTMFDSNRLPYRAIDEALSEAANAGKLEAVKLLVSSGADMHAVGATESAAEMGHTDVVEYLISQGGMPFSALEAAVNERRLQTTQYLVNYYQFTTHEYALLIQTITTWAKDNTEDERKIETLLRKKRSELQNTPNRRLS
ncbi:MAG: ankyrin repeat domain-containing protein [Candidatus Paceibacterota bacterium]|jgi:ankyrin repeat protein